MNRLIIVGSPRVDGRSAELAAQLFEACIEDCPQDEVALAPVATLGIEGCLGCNCCRHSEDDDDDDDAFAGPGASADADMDVNEHADVCDRGLCVIEDDMQELYQLIDAADELIVVSPVYFAGPPSQLKALLDRLQPYYWANTRARVKRPAVLHVVGEGGDPHGFDPLVGTVRSALSCAGFSLEAVYDWVGKIGENGEITAEADVRDLNGKSGVQGGSGRSDGSGGSCGTRKSGGSKGGKRRG